MTDLGAETIGDVAPRFEEDTIVKTEAKEEPCDPEPAGGAIASYCYEEEITTTKTEVMEESYDPPPAGDDVELSSSESAELAGEESGRSRDRDRLSGGDNARANRQKKFECDTCGYTTNQRGNLTRHHSAVHTKKKTRAWGKSFISVPQDGPARKAKYKCETCKYSTRVKRKMVAHIYTHSDRKRTVYMSVRAGDAAEKTFSCPFCDRAYFEKRNLVLHMDVKHVGGKRFRCDRCEFATAYGVLLKKHKLVRHSGAEKAYRCGRCAYSAHFKYQLEKHERTHTRVRPFGCSECDYAAASNCKLEEHVLVRHSGEPRAHRCAECRFASHFKGNLAKHVAEVHGGERRFECSHPGCGFRSSRRFSLQRHVACRHSIGRDRDQ